MPKKKETKEEGFEITVSVGELEETIKKINADEFLVHVGKIMKYVNKSDILRQVEGRVEFENVTLVYGSFTRIGEYICRQDGTLIVRY